MTKHETPPLSPEELERYARHIVLPEIGGAGQQRLKRARVLVIGAGGLGAPVLEYLAAAGVGTLGLVDDDVVALSNLQRQVIHDTQAVGLAKTESAARSIARINPHVSVDIHPLRLTTANAAELIRGYDIVADGSDNFDTRYAVADACAAEQKPLVTAALFPEPPPAGLVPSCAEAGIIGALTGVIGTLQALEVIKLITGIGEPLLGRLLLYDALAARFDTIRYGGMA